jgi:hypothetical protein
VTLNYNFLGITGNILQTPAQNFSVHGHPLLIQDGNKQAVVLNKTGQYIEIKQTGTKTCISDIKQCTSGFKFEVKLKFIAINATSKMYVLSSLQQGHAGIELYYLNGTYHLTVVSSKASWNLAVEYEVKLKIWHTYLIEWSPSFGLALYVDNCQVGKTFTAIHTDVNLQASSLIIGSSSLIHFSYSTHMLITGMKEIIKTKNGNHLFDNDRLKCDSIKFRIMRICLMKLANTTIDRLMI